MTKIGIDLHAARSGCADRIEHALGESNKLWHGVIRLIITLSSSFLLLTLALVDKLFPQTQVNTDFSTYLIISWIFLFIAIVSGIIAELDNTIFFANQGKTWGRLIKEIDEKIAQGLKEDIIDIPQKYIINAPIIWGVISINSFDFAVYCMCLSFLEKSITLPNMSLLLIVGIMLFAGISFYLIGKRK